LGFRCTAHSSKLDHDFDDAIQHLPLHTEALMDADGEDGGKKLWDGYGIVSDVIVCFLLHGIILPH